jgi:hypothetical protein
MSAVTQAKPLFKTVRRHSAEGGQGWAAFNGTGDSDSAYSDVITVTRG